MKRIYINSRLHHISLTTTRRPKDMIFSQGEPWVLLTDGRWKALVKLLGRRDPRIVRLYQAKFPEETSEVSINEPEVLPRVEQDHILNRQARDRLRLSHPEVFLNGVLSPNWKIDYSRRLDRDWDAAVERVLTGASYRTVARDINCSVGLLHQKVHEQRRAAQCRTYQMLYS